MICRIAESLYWMGRYTERIENHARLIDASFHAYQELTGCEEERQKLWRKLLYTLGELQDYTSRQDLTGEKGILFYMTFQQNHPNSIFSCLQKARNNGRAIRERIPGFMFESLNAAYLWLKESQTVEDMLASPYMFYQQIKERVALFYGIADSTMLRQYEWHMLQCGRYLERAENTIRILRMATLNLQESEQAQQYSQLITILKTLDGLEAFRKFYAADITTANVLRFLLLHPVFPRSVLFPFIMLERHLSVMKTTEHLESFTRRPNRLITKIQASLLDWEDDCTPAQVELFLQELLTACNDLGKEFSQSFFREEV